MPYAFLLDMHRINDAPLPIAVGEYVHAAFFDLLARSNGDLATRLHAPVERRPFTLALQGKSRKGQGDVLLRVTILDDALFTSMMEALLICGHPLDVRLGEAQFSITRAITASDSHPWTGCVRYTDLVNQSLPVETVILRFATPTVFRSQGRDVLWPDPRLVWQSWARAWQPYGNNEYLARIRSKASVTYRFAQRTRRILKNYVVFPQN